MFNVIKKKVTNYTKAYKEIFNVFFFCLFVSSVSILKLERGFNVGEWVLMQTLHAKCNTPCTWRYDVTHLQEKFNFFFIILSETQAVKVYKWCPDYLMACKQKCCIWTDACVGDKTHVKEGDRHEQMVYVCLQNDLTLSAFVAIMEPIGVNKPLQIDACINC